MILGVLIFKHIRVTSGITQDPSSNNVLQLSPPMQLHNLISLPYAHEKVLGPVVQN